MLLPRFEGAYDIQVGCDEAGRGCLAGPVVAAAVILPRGYSNPHLDDSKKLSLKWREELRAELMEKAVEYGIGIASNEEVDEINILQASFLAMHRAIDQLKSRTDVLLIDGNRFKPYHDLPHYCIIQGDGKYQSIAAAAIIAKTERDRIMKDYHSQFPMYAWDKNKGYASAQHIAAIETHGYTPIHRKTFKLKKHTNQLFLFE